MTIFLLLLFLATTSIRFGLTFLNLSHLKQAGGTIPPELSGALDADRLRRITEYTIAKARLGMIESVIGSALIVLFLFGGLLGIYDRWISSLPLSPMLGSTFFFLLLLAAETMADIPFSLYRNFRLEARFGFNRLTPMLWLSDLLKSLALSLIIAGLAIGAVFALIDASPRWWWLWVWGFLFVYGLLVMYIAPYVIEPLFFKFKPLGAEGLEEKVRSLMGKAGISVSRVFEVDASRRSGHSNAYFTGIGRVKRIVLFDTLLKQMGHDEILAVLGHEAGHWKKRHVFKQIVLSQALALAGLAAAFHLLSWDGLPGLLGLEQASLAARALILAFLFSMALFPLTPLFSWLSRRNERSADRFASDITGNPRAMADALVKLSRENLSNLHPHPLYAAFYYSHPPVVERVRALRASSASGR